MAGLRVSSSFYPIRLNAYIRNEAELTIEIENTNDTASWTECDVIVPDALSLAPDRELTKGRLRIGIIGPKETRVGKCKVYAGARTYPDTYMIKLVAYGYGKDGAISTREEKKSYLRCEQLGK